MVHINLLPVRQIKRKAAAKKQLATVFLSFLLLLGLLGVVGFLQSSKATGLQRQIADLNHEKQRHAATLRLIKKLEKDKAVIETRIGIIKQLKKSTSLTVHILDETANITPSRRLWLTSLTQDGNNLQLSGMALDNRTIAKYMEDLKSSPYISGVSLAGTSLKHFAGKNLKSFSMSCTIEVPDSK
ncbi:MAG: pilus assembly protein PilN, partial [Desulfobulbus sp.]